MAQLCHNNTLVMAKPANTLETIHITISTTRLVQAYLERLVLTGVYGKNPADAAERLLTDALKSLIEDKGSLLYQVMPLENGERR
jgi:hypothetical protein